ncbi:MAG: NACHT domain-containing protein, partial [Candidatus Electrothrix sp. AR3]|nr:NACHT domain-containing protein [Candidatus Electrothrix sp. AR3]
MSDQPKHIDATDAQIGILGDNANVKEIHFHQSAPPSEPPRQLPPLDACFLGRDKELAELVNQLHPGKVVAVCGPGGMGKTALAAQAVHKLEEDRFPEGIVFHSFYHQSSTGMVLQTICQAFQVEAKAGLTAAVQTALAGKKALLILDGAEDAEDLKAVLDLRSTCGVLITSRKRSDAQGFRL